MRKGLIISVFFSFLFLPSVTGNGEVFLHIGEEDGLSQRWIRSIHQDSYGFMWFGTKDGLNRYDGSEFRYYKPDPDKQGLSSPTINYITEDNLGRLWVCTSRGVNLYDREKDKFDIFPLIQEVDVLQVLQTDSFTYWFATLKGLYRFNVKDSLLTIYQHQDGNPQSLCCNFVSRILEDTEKNIWVSTQEGLSIFKTKDSCFLQAWTSSYANTRIFDLKMDQKGRVWISAYFDGLDVYIPDDGNYYDTSFKRVLSGLARALWIDQNNTLYISWGQKQGFTSYNLSDFDAGYGVFNGRGTGNHYLVQNSIDVIYTDRWNNKWFGTYDRGLFYQSPEAKKFYIVNEPPEGKRLSNYLINVIFEDKEFMWIGTEYGLNRIRQSNGESKIFTYDPDNPRSIGASAIYAITKDSEGNLWIGTWNGGLNLYHPETEDFTCYKHNSADPENRGTENVFSIIETSPGELLLGTVTGGGLLKFNVRNKLYTNLSKHLYETGAPENNSVSHILKTSDGKLWISSYTAIHVYDPVSQKYTWYAYDPYTNGSLTLGDIVYIFEDSRKTVWVATEGGLNYFLPQSGTFNNYTTFDGLPSNFINAIEEDHSGNLWISTNNGISKFVKGINLPEDPQFINYSKVDGLSSREFIKRSCFKDSKGRLYFGGVNGYTYFYPDSITQNPESPPVILTDLYVLNERVIPGAKESVLDKDIYLIDQLKLKYNQNVFTICFAGLNFLNPQKNQYLYKLDGFDKKWVKTGSDPQAVYTNINPGKYIFRVKASNNDGVWNNEGVSLPIIITPPWWRTLLARLIFAMAIISALILLYRFRVRALTFKKDLLEAKVAERTLEITTVNTQLEEIKEEVILQNEELMRHRNDLENLIGERTHKLQLALQKAEEADRLKSSFLANMSHEIRTPMNAIVGFANLMDSDDLDQESRKEYIKIINFNTQSLLVLIDDILEISLIEANQVNIQNKVFDIDRIFTELEQIYRLRNDKNLSIEFVNKPLKEHVQVYSDPIRLNQCMSNLLSNALKFTDTGYVKFGYTLSENEINCFVSDTGIGIERNELEHIFEFFYKVESNKSKLYRGTGLGLAITSKLVKLMGGSVWAESEPSSGSTFHIKLPYLKIDSTRTVEEEKPASLKGNFKDLLILVAEDEPANYMLIMELLQKTGAKTEIVNNGLAAFEFVKKHADHKNLLVLMDIKMPVMDGITAFKKIREEGINIPVIALTAYAAHQDKHNILAAGFTGYIAKPVRPDELLGMIRKTQQEET